MATPKCKLCNELQKKEWDARLALDFQPQELVDSAQVGGCCFCALILGATSRFAGAIRAQEPASVSPAQTLVDRVSRIYVYGLANPRDTLSLELYTKNDEPKRVLELFYPDKDADCSSNSSIRGCSPTAAIKSRPSVSGHPLSEKGLKWVKHRLDTCLSTHELCLRGKKTLPKRVLTFERLSHSEEISVHILEDSQREVDYATLSHRWGSHQDCVTTKALLQEHKKALPWSQLPQTFRDSIEFCLAIGINYLWIDALCIVQDDDADWHIEAAKMADVYQNSYITLAATSASSGTAGCFHGSSNSKQEHRLYEESRALASTEGSTSRLAGDVEAGDVISVRQKASHWDNSVGVKTARLHPLLTRGWVFQERILSSRMLHFCAEEMVWECRTETLCECGSLPPGTINPRELFTRITQSPVLPEAHARASSPCDALLREPEITDGQFAECISALQKELDDMDSESDEMDVESEAFDAPGINDEGWTSHMMLYELYEQYSEMAQDTSGRVSPPPYSTFATLFPILNEQPMSARHWQAMVGQYSSLHLTEETDRLPALSGLADRTSPHLGRYLAGLWSSTFPSDLAWRVHALKTGSTRLPGYRGPSWSWASLNDAIRYWDDLRTHVRAARVPIWHLQKPRWLSWAVVPKGQNPFGEVSSAEVAVEGLICPVRLQYVWTQSWPAKGPYESVHDPFQYKILFKGGLELPFFADHILSEQRADYLDHDAELDLLLIHPDVCLVLRPLWQNRGGYPAYRRVGIFRQPEALESVYGDGVNWMEGSDRDTIVII